ncbi:hypothetical protein KUCAC02_013918, partial [Chaenocephalus aceratus]
RSSRLFLNAGLPPSSRRPPPPPPILNLALPVTCHLRGIPSFPADKIFDRDSLNQFAAEPP